MKSKQHVLVELKQFIHVVSNYRNTNKLISPSVVRSSIVLLQDLPASREIIFEYFASVADLSIQNFVSTVNVDPQTGVIRPSSRDNNASQQQQADEEANNCFLPIQETLENLVLHGSATWGPLLAGWSLDLVGRLSDKYSPRSMSLEATCNYWLNCPAMRGLLKIINYSFRTLNSTDTEACVQSMLVSFQRYNLTFDWVVARLGGCFPFKIMSNILQTSLKRFAEDNCYRFDSEVGILDYLSKVNETELRVAFRDMLQDGLQPKKTIDASIVPFLLGISNFSETLLQSLVSVFLEIYNDDVRAAIIQKCPLWLNNKLFSDMLPSLNNIALRLKSHGVSLLIGVSRMAEQYNWCQEFLEYSLQELQQVVLNVHLCPLLEDLVSEESKRLLWKSCLSSNAYEQQTAIRLLLVASTQNTFIYYQTISELLRKPSDLNNNALAVIVRLVGGQSGVVEFPDVKAGIEIVLEDVLLYTQFPDSRLTILAGPAEPLNTFKNLNTLTKMQKMSNFPFMKQQLLATALLECVPKILHILEVALSKIMLRINAEAAKVAEERMKALQSNNNNTLTDFYATAKKPKLSNGNESPMQVDAEPETDGLDEDELEERQRHSNRLALAHIIMDLLNSMEVGSKMAVMRTNEVLKLSVLTTKYFFISLSEKSPLLRSTGVNRALSLFQRHCGSRKAARTACLRELIEGALFYHGDFFGQSQEPEVDELEIPAREMVLLQNQRQTSGPNANRTVLHAGVIGRGLRPGAVPKPVDAKQKDLVEMQTYLLRALEACCVDGVERDNSGYAMISLLLVEMVSTDVMYNGLPFPDEEFTKVTMERDLMIRRSFVNSPILWTMLGFIASHRPALCFSSVLLRALCATCLHQWRAKNVSKFHGHQPNEELMQCTKKLLRLLGVGQLLPPPLSSLHLIIEHFDAPEIALLLKECVWNYLKDHVPSPALFHVDANGLHWRNPALAKIPPQYVDTLRNIMQKKLTKLGPHYHQMFIMSELNSPPTAAGTITPTPGMVGTAIPVQPLVVPPTMTATTPGPLTASPLITNNKVNVAFELKMFDK